MKLFTIHDSKAEFYGQPFFARTAAEALRSFQQAVNDDPSRSPIAAHPADFTLFEIGSFDEQTATVTALESKHSLGNGVDFRKPVLPVQQ